MKSLGFALGSGGARGVAHIGFLQAMEENQIFPDYIAGSSMGALVGACYAKGMPIEEMKKIIFDLRMRDLLDLNILPIKSMSIFKSTKIKSLFDEYLGGSDFDTLNIPFKCVAVDILSGEKKVLTKGNNFVGSVLASCSIPTIFKPIEMDDMLFVDGGVASRVPVDVVKEMGADIVIGVDVLGRYKKVENIKNIFQLMLRTIELMDYTNTERQRREQKDIIDLWIEPDLADAAQYSFKNLEKTYDSGYECGMSRAGEIKKIIGR